MQKKGPAGPFCLVAFFLRRDLAGDEAVELFTAERRRLAALHARNRDGVPDAVGSRFHLAAAEAHGLKSFLPVSKHSFSGIDVSDRLRAMPSSPPNCSTVCRFPD
jgi:hypothetical protein